MATTLTNIQLGAFCRATLNDTVEGAGVIARPGKAISQVFANGTGEGQADRQFQDLTRSLSSATSVNHDLFDLASFDLTTDALRNAVTFAEITGLYIENLPTSSGNLEVGGLVASTAWVSLLKDNTDILILPTDSFLCVGCRADPAWAVTDVTNHLLKFNAPSGAVNYLVVLLGRSA